MLILLGGLPEVYAQDFFEHAPSVALTADTLPCPDWEITPTPGFVRKADRKWNIQNLGQDQNLQALDVFSMAQDPFGRIWIGGQGGQLICFDGKHLKSVIIPNFEAKIESLFFTQNGDLWIGGWGTGVMKYDGRRFVHYALTNLVPQQETALVWSIYEDSQSRIWIGTNNAGAFLIDGDTAYPLADHLPNGFQHVTCFLELPDGTIWIGDSSMGIAQFNGNKFTTHPAYEGNPGSVRCMALMDDHTVWAGFRTVLELDVPSGKWQTVESLEGLGVWGIERIRDLTYVATNRNGIVVMDGTRIKQQLDVSAGMSGDRIITLMQDRDQNVWYGTFGEGIGKLGNQTFRNLSSANGLQNDKAWSLEWFHNDLLIGYSGGGVDALHRDGTVSTISLPHGNTADIHDMLASDNTLWIAASDHGLYRFDGASMTTLTRTSSENARNHIYSLASSPTGTIVAGGLGGLNYVKGDSLLPIPLPGLEKPHIWEVVFDSKGTLWAATGSHGIFAIPDFDPTKPPRTLIFDQSNGNVSNDIFALAISGPTLFIGSTHHGIVALNSSGLLDYLQGGSKPEISRISTEDGLPSNDIRALKRVGNDLWAGTMLGIARIENVDGPSPHAVIVYDEDAGMITTGITMNNAVLGPEDELWWCTSGYISAYEPQSDHRDGTAPHVVVDKILLHDEWINHSSADSMGFIQEEHYFTSLFPNYRAFKGFTPWTSIPSDMHLSYDENDLTFEFNVLDWTKEESVAFRTRLVGKDDKWARWRYPSQGAEQRIAFNFLPPGEYTFQVQGRNAEGLISEPVEIHFRISPPFWKTNGFIIGVILLTLALVYSVFRYRLKRLEKENVKLENTVLKRTEQLRAAKKKSDDLLLNILPASTAEELKEKGSAKARNYPSASVLFSDFKGFTQLTEITDAPVLVESLHEFFRAFDKASAKWGIEKIKTIGDAYMCASGIPESDPEHAIKLASFGLEMLEITRDINAGRQQRGLPPWPIRIGIHSGPLIAGVVGEKKFAYDIWGDTVNTAARMESSGEAGKLNISQGTYELIRSKFSCTARGKISAKNKGEMEMYFVDGKL
ncbi:MAG: hypothetical protein KDC12_05010 [Flavobacteriales bacterium]|nr:hypothetical protein [Flavobacteriales bacterium]